MTPVEIGAIAIVVLLILIVLGMPIGLGMLATSFCGVALIRNDTVAMRMMAQVANDSLEDYLFAVVPLFVLMGLLVTVSKVGKDTFDIFQKLLRRVTAGLGVATVFANAIFAAITGISIASATVFSRIAVPEMRRHGYTDRFATGVVAGSSVLGMLIPPSLLMIVYAVLAEQSVGRMFIAGIGPGILLSIIFTITIMLLVFFNRDFVFAADDQEEYQDLSAVEFLQKCVPIISLIIVVLGGLYGGFLNPTEAGAAGAFGALVIAILRRSLDKKTFWRLLIETGQITVSVLFLILAATFFSRMLALSGVPRELAELFLNDKIGPYGFLFAYILLIILLGCLIDSISIMLIVLPIALPVAEAAELNLIWFGVISVISVEIGLLTPPFGLSVYTIKSALNEQTLTVGEIFRGASPFIVAMLISLIIIIFFPAIATWLTNT